MRSHNYEGPRYKIIVVGDGGVGKTAILERLLGRAFHSTYKLTIGANILTKQLIFDGTTFKLQIWDLAGQTRFTIVRSTYYSGAHAAILCFDKNWPPSFESLPTWKNEVESHLGRKIPLLLIGNKNDLPSQITQDKIDEYITSVNANHPCTMPYLSTSAKTGSNMSQVLKTLAQLLTSYKTDVGSR
ncbi:MAG: Rab family GTPase [Candidatus Thorarchaeota archaeon]